MLDDVHTALSQSCLSPALLALYTVVWKSGKFFSDVDQWHAIGESQGVIEEGI
jgi:hypothetical protein